MNYEIFSIILLILGIYFSIELIIYLLCTFVNKKFPWLIMYKDTNPILSSSALQKFIIHGYDSEIGWVRKPKTSHDEVGKEGTTRWTINNIGSRTNPNFENINSKISCYGDSFTFCRQVNDDQTWEHFLSKFQKTNVLNFGVGNHGIDQTILRINREFPKNKTDIVIVGIVPDTISRIMSIWKHYYEYGNTFGFKPRFIINNNKLKLIPNPINNKDKFFDYNDYLDIIQKNDFFYEKKFKKEIIKFPFVFSFLKNFKRNFLIIYWILSIEISKKNPKKYNKIKWNPMKIIMNINLKWRIKLYKNRCVTKLFYLIIQEFIRISKQNDFHPFLVFIPQKDDVLFIKKNFHFYENFIKKLNDFNNLEIIDITKYFLEEKDLDLLYSDNSEYGGHLSKEGNFRVAEIIHDKLSSHNIS